MSFLPLHPLSIHLSGVGSRSCHMSREVYPFVQAVLQQVELLVASCLGCYLGIEPKQGLYC